MNFVVENYRYEPFSASIWRLKIASLNVIVQCIEPLGEDFGDAIIGRSIYGNLILEMAQVRAVTDAYIPPCFSILKENFNLSDGSLVQCIGTASDILTDDNEFKLASVIELVVKAESMPRIDEGSSVSVEGLLKFKPMLPC